jgi:L,D-transpeptidase-like protein
VPPTATPPPTATAVPSPTPVPTPVPQLTAGSAIVVGGELRTRKTPATTSELVATLSDHAMVQVAARVAGENWLVGTQTWAMSPPPWASEWFRLADGSFVYGAFVFLLQPGEVSPLQPVPAGVEKWIDVNLTNQTARAMAGDKAVFTAPVSTGAAPFITPEGHFAVEPDGRIAVEKMTATQAGYDARQAQYDVERVLFTQYFDQKGDALHLNYWRPHSVFGKMATSHGCVGIELHEAQYFWLFGAPGMRVEIHK